MKDKHLVWPAEVIAKMQQAEIKGAPSKAPLLASMLAVTAAIIAVVSLVLSGISYQKTTTPITFLNNGADGNAVKFTDGSIADMAKQVSGSVVSIITETKAASWFSDDYTASAAGTGIIVSKDGYILTNKHVVNGATKVSVISDDGTTYRDVSVVGSDPLNDVAFLKISGVDNLPAARLGNSKTIAVGQQVVAIGNALGQYQNTVTSGIISGIGRSITAATADNSMQETLTDMIQTDAAINAGNSGGPLINAAGEVIGINTATSAEGSGIGFAIPISSIKGMLSALIETGEAKRGFIGVYYTNITPEVAKSYNLPVQAGAYIHHEKNYSAIVKNSPADKAGLHDKDIITAINGVSIGAAGSMASILGEYKPGDTVQLVVLREGHSIAINVTLGDYQKE